MELPAPALGLVQLQHWRKLIIEAHFLSQKKKKKQTTSSFTHSLCHHPLLLLYSIFHHYSKILAAESLKRKEVISRQVQHLGAFISNGLLAHSPKTTQGIPL